MVISGVTVLISNPHHPEYPSHFGLVQSFNENKWFFGPFIILTGVLLIWSSLRKKAKHYLGEVFMCPVCLNPIMGIDAANLKCPTCGRDLEPLKGFYDRHPELKEDD
ncbi:hypothetical protein Dalk_0272 [Desulfatibacillum aliphaticivorans]|uniref:Uncharacterized protein n=2 Tax=Desulfatibacillum aliphaticivorans TaxID=218208 RepID=B8F8U9_DESAL|nr:hypothetical protein Dalk_0272 [Desulfatibacillum aliphaticivorans]